MFLNVSTFLEHLSDIWQNKKDQKKLDLEKNLQLLCLNFLWISQIGRARLRVLPPDKFLQVTRLNLPMIIALHCNIYAQLKYFVFIVLPGFVEFIHKEILFFINIEVVKKDCFHNWLWHKQIVIKSELPNDPLHLKTIVILYKIVILLPTLFYMFVYFLCSYRSCFSPEIVNGQTWFNGIFSAEYKSYSKQMSYCYKIIK